MQAHRRAAADRRHRLRLGEDLRVRPDADLEVLRPEPARRQRRFQRLGRRRAGADAGQIPAQQAAQVGAQRLGGVRIALGALLDHPLDQAVGEGDARRLDGRQVARREQPALGQRRIEAGQPHAGVLADLGRRIRQVEQVAHGRREGREVEEAAVARRDDVRAVVQPEPADQRAGVAIDGQDVGGGEPHAARP
jgi:hypothetical protein